MVCLGHLKFFKLKEGVDLFILEVGMDNGTRLCMELMPRFTGCLFNSLKVGQEMILLALPSFNGFLILDEINQIFPDMILYLGLTWICEITWCNKISYSF